jgi:hypothetical protein
MIINKLWEFLDQLNITMQLREPNQRELCAGAASRTCGANCTAVIKWTGE